MTVFIYFSNVFRLIFRIKLKYKGIYVGKPNFVMPKPTNIKGLLN